MSAASLARNQKRLDRLKHQLIQLDAGIKKLQGQCDNASKYRQLKGVERALRISLNAISLRRDFAEIPRLENEDRAEKTFETYQALFVARHRIDESLANLRALGADPNWALSNLPESLLEADVTARLGAILQQTMDLGAVNLGSADEMDNRLFERRQLLIEIEKYQRRIDKNL